MEALPDFKISPAVSCLGDTGLWLPLCLLPLHPPPVLPRAPAPPCLSHLPSSPISLRLWDPALSRLPGHPSRVWLQVLQESGKSGVRRDLFSSVSGGETEGQEVRTCVPSSTVTRRRSWATRLQAPFTAILHSPFDAGDPRPLPQGKQVGIWSSGWSLPPVRPGHSQFAGEIPICGAWHTAHREEDGVLSSLFGTCV